jgi:hypothetical protein
MLYMKTTILYPWVMAAAFVTAMPGTVGAMSGHGFGGSRGGGFHESGGHHFGPRGGFHGAHFAGRPFDRRFVHHHDRFFFGFDFVAFGFPDWWDPDYYYAYPDSDAADDQSPVYDYRYWAGIGTAVQNELARLGYYNGSIDGIMGPASREAIRSFQRAENLPVTGLIDPSLLKALKLPAVPRVASSD